MVPVPDCVVTSQGLPGTMFPRVMNSSGISWTAPDDPGNLAATDTDTATTAPDWL